MLSFAFYSQPKFAFYDDGIGGVIMMVKFIHGIGFPALFQNFAIALLLFFLFEILKA